MRPISWRSSADFRVKVLITVFGNVELLAVAGGFDFCSSMRRLCSDMCARHTALRHIRMDDVAVTYAQTRSVAEWGIQARLTPLRFQGGATTERRSGRIWKVQPVYWNGREMLYVLTFYLPRFLNLCFDEKLVTVFHELYHISPRFDGDIRRFGGACYIHTGSQKSYDRHMAVLAAEYLGTRPSEELLGFLRLSFSELQRKCGGVVGLKIAVPRLLAVREVA